MHQKHPRLDSADRSRPSVALRITSLACYTHTTLRRRLPRPPSSSSSSFFFFFFFFFWCILGSFGVSTDLWHVLQTTGSLTCACHIFARAHSQRTSVDSPSQSIFVESAENLTLEKCRGGTKTIANVMVTTWVVLHSAFGSKCSVSLLFDTVPPDVIDTICTLTT